MTEHIKHPEINAKKIFIEDEVLNTNHIINAADVAGANLSNALEGLHEAITTITGLGTALEDLEDNKVDKTSIKQGIGSSTTDVMSQKAVTDGLNTKFDKESVKQVIGTSLTEVMSQDAASKNFLIDANNTSQRKVFVQNGTPTGMNVGDIWIKI